jgi:hypothetical protein
MTIVRGPHVADLGMLYQFHRARVAKESAGRSPTLERMRNAVERIKFEHTQTYTRLVAAGYYKAIEKTQKYQPTLKGAYLMTWKLLPPFKQVQIMRKNATSEQLLKELGFGGLAAFKAMKSERKTATAPVNVTAIDPSANS